MDPPNVDGVLVTADNPARADRSGMDHARCAALHNYLVRYAWLAEGRPLASLNNGNTFFTAHGAAAESLRPRLDPSLAAFLDTAVLSPTEHRRPLFFWANDFSDPDGLFADFVADLFDEPVDSLVCLYWPNTGQGGGSGGGLFYHQNCHRAAVFMDMIDHDFTLPVKAHPTLWHPLETVLSNWINLIRLGKITASASDVPARFGVEKIGPWEWQPYSEAQVAACVGAWDRLCGAIDARYPPADEAEFAAGQPFTRLPRGPQAIPPVCLFSTAKGEREADITGPLSPFSNDFCARSSDSLVPNRIPAGVYSESVERNNYDNAEEGFRLLLPYGLEGGAWYAPAGSAGARKSDRSFVKRGSVADLFQHGYKPFGGDYYRPQRLESLLDHWGKLVDEGVWSSTTTNAIEPEPLLTPTTLDAASLAHTG